MARKQEQLYQWRADRIRRFTERQKRARDWINFAEIADWCAKEDKSIIPDEEKRGTAYKTLVADLLDGEFEECGRSRILYLHPGSSRARMTREWLRDVIEHNYDGRQGRSQYLPQCWMPRSMFDRWLAKHRLQASPKRFEPAGSQPSRNHGCAHDRKRSKRDEVVAYIAEHYPKGVPASVPLKVIAHECGVSERTVRRALGRK